MPSASPRLGAAESIYLESSISQAGPASERAFTRPLLALISRLQLLPARRPRRDRHVRSSHARSRRPAAQAVPNQTPPLCDYNLFTTDEALQEAVRREGGGRPRGATRARRGRHRLRRELRARTARQSLPARAAELQRARRAHRCARISSVLACPHGGHRGTRLSQRPMGARGRPARGRRACGARGGLLDASTGGMRHVVPDHHDLRRDRGAAPRSRARARLAAAAAHAALRPRDIPIGAQARRPRSAWA